MKSITPLTYAVTKLFCHGLSFTQALVLMMFSAIVFAGWLKWHMLHIFVLCLAVTFFVISPQEFCTRLVAQARNIGQRWLALWRKSPANVPA